MINWSMSPLCCFDRSQISVNRLDCYHFFFFLLQTSGHKFLQAINLFALIVEEYFGLINALIERYL